MLTYRHAAATAYLDAAKGHEQSYDGILLCDVHASRFSAPLGWTTVDRTGSEPLVGGDDLGPMMKADTTLVVPDAD